MSERTTISVIDESVVSAKLAGGFWEPLAGFKVGDCAEDRGVTDAIAARRSALYGSDILPGRFFGASYGLSIVSLTAVAATVGETQFKQLYGELSNGEAIADFTATVADGMKQVHDVDMVVHSAEKDEEHPLDLSAHSDDGPVGCAVVAGVGPVVAAMNHPITARDCRRVRSLSGMTMPLEAAADGAAIVGRVIAPTLGVHRGAIRHTIKDPNRHTPFAMHAGDHAASHQTHAVIDFAGFRSDARRHVLVGNQHFHHTPRIASEYLPPLLDVPVDEQLLTASALRLASAARLALSGPRDPHALSLQVVPTEYARPA